MRFLRPPPYFKSNRLNAGATLVTKRSFNTLRSVQDNYVVRIILNMSMLISKKWPSYLKPACLRISTVDSSLFIV